MNRYIKILDNIVYELWLDTRYTIVRKLSLLWLVKLSGKINRH